MAPWLCHYVHYCDEGSLMTDKQLEKPSDYCKRRQEEELNKGNTEEALRYYELAKHWMSKGM